MTDKLHCPCVYSKKRRGKSLGDYERSIYNRWATMIGRCENPHRDKYKEYGGRGIKVCKEWHDIRKFAAWCKKSGYKATLQLDRIDNNGNYCPENCRWVSVRENCQNCRRTRFLTIAGVKRAASEWARISSISSYTIYWWMNTKGDEYAASRINEKLGGKK